MAVSALTSNVPCCSIHLIIDDGLFSLSTYYSTRHGGEKTCSEAASKLTPNLADVELVKSKILGS